MTHGLQRLAVALAGAILGTTTASNRIILSQRPIAQPIARVREWILSAGGDYYWLSQNSLLCLRGASFRPMRVSRLPNGALAGSAAYLYGGKLLRTDLRDRRERVLERLTRAFDATRGIVGTVQVSPHGRWMCWSGAGGLYLADIPSATAQRLSTHGIWRGCVGDDGTVFALRANRTGAVRWIDVRSADRGRPPSSIYLGDQTAPVLSAGIQMVASRGRLVVAEYDPASVTPPAVLEIDLDRRQNVGRCHLHVQRADPQYDVADCCLSADGDRVAWLLQPKLPPTRARSQYRLVVSRLDGRQTRSVTIQALAAAAPGTFHLHWRPGHRQVSLVEGDVLYGATVP